MTDVKVRAEELRRWAAARAGWLTANGGGELLENEVALLRRLGLLYDRSLTQAQALAFLEQLPGAVLPVDLSSKIPFPPLRIPVSVGVTYAVGCVAEQWLQDGCPPLSATYAGALQRQIFRARFLVDELREHPDKKLSLA